MSALLVVISTWLHVLATIVMIGYFPFASLFYLPVIERYLHANERKSAASGLQMSWLILIFLVTPHGMDGLPQS
jgi:hypothetical protein